MIAALGPAVRAGRLSADRRDRGRARPPLRPRLRRAPAGGQAPPAAPGRPRRRRAVRPARPHPGDAGRGRVRRHRRHLRGRAALLARPRGGRPVAVRPRSRSRSSRTGNGAGPNQMPTAAQFAAGHRRAARAAGHRPRGDALRQPGHGPGHLPAGSVARLRRAVRLDRLRPHRRPLVRRAGRGRRQHLVPRRERPRHRRPHDRGHRNRRGHRPHRRRGVRPVTPAAPVRRHPDPARARRHPELLAGRRGAAPRHQPHRLHPGGERQARREQPVRARCRRAPASST